MNVGEVVEKVKMYADQAHGDQMRKYANERYIVHPIRVMELVREYSHDLPILSAALLHDVLEDTPVSEYELRSFLESVMDEATASRTLKLVIELTDVYVKANYPRLNRTTRRIKEAERLALVSAEAQSIKYADLIDNMHDIARHDTDFALVYIRESKDLLSYITAGDLRLRERAVGVVDNALRGYFEKANIKAL